MIFIYAIALIVFLLFVYLFNGTLQAKLCWWFGKNVRWRMEGDCEVFIADNFPFFGYGRYYIKKVFVKRAYYSDGKTEYVRANPEELKEGFRGTENTVTHELTHDKQYDRYVEKYGKLIGSFLYFGWATANQIGYFLRIYKTEDGMPIEKEPEKEEAKI